MTGRQMLACTALAGGVFVGCGQGSQPDCVIPPCVLPTAIVVTVTSDAGRAIPGLTLTLLGAMSGSAQCTVDASASTCYVPGMAGTYDLALAAPGFQSKRVTVVVSGSSPACKCPIVETQQTRVVLTSK